ncbi:hypothetical protein [Beijerinckia sp. L45]|uniref:hypothetical protein n=1 Tax=Beijerinckia sp. L45 TaxID=1641855 RepID=UPI00131C5E96|nr:hypothetical protein [Beijerinckia sp. L45]
MPPATPTFGKRNRASAAPRQNLAPTPAAGPAVAIPDQAAFFAAARQEIDPPDTRRKIVPRSFRAALLAGLVVAFCLAGLDITKAAAVDPALEPLLKMSGLLANIGQALPYMIALSLLSGARTAATTLLIAHRLLAWRGESGYLAYAAGGAAAAAVWTVLVLVLLGHAPTHGWVLDIAAGAGAGFFYRMFAGATRV